MTRDEILAAIERLSTATDHYPSTALDVAESMREVCRLADEYMNNERWDNQYIAEAVPAAMERFADMLHGIA